MTARLRALITAYVIDRLHNTPSRWNLGFSVLPPESSPGMLRRLIRLHFNHYLANGVIDPSTFEYKDGQTLETSPEVIDSYTKDEDMNGRLDLTLPFREGASTVKVGVRLRDKEKRRDNVFFRAAPVTSAAFAKSSPMV